jgi:hypothetical protein
MQILIFEDTKEDLSEIQLFIGNCFGNKEVELKLAHKTLIRELVKQLKL